MYVDVFCCEPVYLSNPVIEMCLKRKNSSPIELNDSPASKLRGGVTSEEGGVSDVHITWASSVSSSHP